jgi:hypothetical protein
MTPSSGFVERTRSSAPVDCAADECRRCAIASETEQRLTPIRDRYADAGDVPFTVNLGVGLSLLHKEPPWAGRGWPLEYECDFRQRLGPLYKGDDHWWGRGERLANL